MTGAFALHLGATLFMTGVIWLVQLVQYPLFARVGRSEFPTYEAEHVRRISWVVAPAMLLELASAVAVVWVAAGVERTATLWAAPLLVVIWLSTYVVQVPAHARLAKHFDATVHARLVSSNWIRTSAWSVRSLMLLFAALR